MTQLRQAGKLEVAVNAAVWCLLKCVKLVQLHSPSSLVFVYITGHVYGNGVCNEHHVRFWLRMDFLYLVMDHTRNRDWLLVFVAGWKGILDCMTGCKTCNCSQGPDCSPTTTFTYLTLQLSEWAEVLFCHELNFWHQVSCTSKCTCKYMYVEKTALAGLIDAGQD